MKISSWLGQIYFFGMHPKYQEEVAEALRQAPAVSYAGPWRVYSRLARPGLVAIRKVTRSSGLDIFLLGDNQLRGIEDVAEMMFYSVQEPGMPEFLEAHEDGATLFMTFVRLNWDVLAQESLWEEYGLPQPSRSQVFGSFSAALRHATAGGVLEKDALSYQIGGGIGDCDALVVGTTRSRLGLNRFLSTLSQLGTDSLALRLGADAGRLARAHPIVSESVTELGIPWEYFQASLRAARFALEAESGPDWHEEEAKIRPEINDRLAGDLRSAIFLRRTRGALAVGEQVRAILPRHWVLQEVLGEADMLLRFDDPQQGSPATGLPQPQRPPELADLIGLTARLDTAATNQPSFPRRHSVVLSFDRANPAAELGRSVVRASMLGQEEPAVQLQEHLRHAPGGGVAEAYLAKCVAHLTRIHDLRLREELRIIERMVERCAMLQRQLDLPAETRRICQLGLRRIARTLKQLDSQMDGEEGRRALRHSLVNSGAQLERTISHLSRGNVPMLLATPAQARATDHFSSETTLARALAAPASSVAGRLTQALNEIGPLEGDPPAEWAKLLETLRDMTEPIIYTSHGLDFTLARPLGILHVPRWIMWYPTSSSLILHEVGHAVFSEGRLDDLLSACAAEVRKRPALLAWCENIARGAGTPQKAPGYLTGSSRQWRSDQHEIAAELFHRLFSYPAEAASAYLFDQLEYLHAIINRSEELERVSFITRILTVHLAHSLLLRSKGQGSLWDAGREELRQFIEEAVDRFREHLRSWLGSPPPPFATMSHGETKEVKREVETLAATLALHREEPATDEARGEMLRNFHTAVGRAVQRAVFMALAADAGEGIASKNDSTMLAVLVWEATFRCSRAPQQAGEAERALFDEQVAKLQRGEVLDSICAWPERLPRALQTVIRQSAEVRVLVHQRMALSLSLADWMSLQRHQGETPTQ